MSENLLPLPSSAEILRVQRAGQATLCRYVHECLSLGRSALVVVRDSESAALVRSLLPLFEKEGAAEADALAEPVWEKAVLDFAPFLTRFEREPLARYMASLYGLTVARPHCLVVSLESLLLRHPPLTFFQNRVLELGTGQEYAPELIVEQAVDWGYLRVPMVSGPGDLALRGDILDIFPPGYQRPVRLEFFGDSIEEMRLFDADTQRSRQNVSSVTLLPMSYAALTATERKQALARTDALQIEGRLSENACYSIRKALEEGSHKLLPAVIFQGATQLESWLPQDTVFFLPEEGELVTALVSLREQCKALLEDEQQALLQPSSLVLRRSSQPAAWARRPSVVFADQLFGDRSEGLERKERAIASFEALFPGREAQDRPWQALIEKLKTWPRQYHQVLLSFSSQRGRQKFLNLVAQDGIAPRLRYTREPGLYALVAPFRRGAELVWEKTLILGEDILFPRSRKSPRTPARAFKGLHSFDGIEDGDLLVHRDYGIGRFGGLHHLTVNNVANDFLLIEYAGHDKLYVPADNLSLIQRYKGDGALPQLDRLGGQRWNSTREKARKAIEKIAADLVEMYAYRKVAKGFHYGPVSELYHEFEATFHYEETPDQAKAIDDVLDDMAKDTPMDRLVCGDVGFGKTEVALRAAFRAASEGRQVALLCPTTVLAEQHYQTFRSRLAGFPLSVGLLSRFVSRVKQKQILEAAAQGKLDILVGTHRLISNDVHLPNLALLILDEEQRFGVRHKEKLKSLRKNVDVLTLTATPIPRTLQLSMSGIRDLSLIETAPENRKAIETTLINRDPEFLRTILRQELARQGQVFWIYNRVQGLETVCDFVRKLIPEGRVGMAHGRMSEAMLEGVMYSFWHGELDVLVATSIVESGLDFPNVNTIVIDQAQMFGLGQLYQLRGRVGRSDRQAYAYLVVPDTDHVGELAAERLRVLQDMDYLGAGCQLAMEDLRLRGAGNILGESQSGHLSRVGLDLYLEMLEDTVARLKGLPVSHEQECEVNLGLPAHIPLSYMDDSRERMHFYKCLTSAADSREREEIVLEIRDRFGSLPVELVNFVAVLNFKQVLRSLEIARADIYTDRVHLTWSEGQTSVRPETIMQWLAGIAGARVNPPAGLTLPLEASLSFEEALQNLGRSMASLKDDTVEERG
ncbi:MAG: transcription-repair coupling factor [Desulfovibrio sp.]|nr:transcription-repair coupling factor [Desulfovibrio sp.]